MKTMLTTLAFLAALPATAALADDDDCKAPATQAQSWEAVTQLANDYGWTIHWMEMDDGCYELRVTDIGGNSLKAEIDPATLDVIKARLSEGSGAPATGATGGTAPQAAPAN